MCRIVLPDKPAFAKVAACLRLSTKYQVAHMRKMLRAWLAQDFPTTLEQWDAAGDEWRGFQWNLENAFDVANFLREVDIPAFLPTAFMDASKDVYSGYIITGLMRRDGTTSRLSTENQAAIVTGRARIANYLVGCLSSWNRTSNGCDSLRHCMETKDIMLRISHDEGWWTNASVALEPWDDSMVPGQEDAPGLCVKCFQEYKKAYTDHRQQLWDRIPGFFGLEDWDKLRAECE